MQCIENLNTKGFTQKRDAANLVEKRDAAASVLRFEVRWLRVSRALFGIEAKRRQAARSAKINCESGIVYGAKN